MSELPIIQWPGGRPPVPNGPITAPEAWHADEMADSSLWLYQLSEADVSEIASTVGFTQRLAETIKRSL